MRPRTSSAHPKSHTARRRGPEHAPAEVAIPHTRLLQLALAVPESRAYWAHVTPGVPPARRALQAFEERWFGAKSLHRVRRLLTNLAARFDAYPAALEAIRRSPALDPASRRLICHWHLMLADPLYRAFAAGFLVARRADGVPTVDLQAARRFVETTLPDRWGPATTRQFAQKLLAAASEAGLISARVDPRRFLQPLVTDAAIAHLVALLREVRYPGPVLESPYAASLGVPADVLARRLRALGSARP